MNFTDLLPNPNDVLTGPHWQGLKSGKILVPRCVACGYLRWPPASICPECLGSGTEWAEVAGAGTLWSFTVYHRALHPAFKEAIPYAVGIVELDAGVQMIGRLGIPEDQLAVGMRLEAEFITQTPELSLIEWVAS